MKALTIGKVAKQAEVGVETSKKRRYALIGFFCVTRIRTASISNIEHMLSGERKNSRPCVFFINVDKSTFF